MQTGRSIPELTRDMAFHLGDMFRNELKLARVEATDSVKSLGGGIAVYAAGIAAGAATLTMLLLALAFGLGTVLPMWAACLVTAGVGGVLAWGLLAAGKAQMKPKTLTLPRTREQISRDIRNISEHVH